MIDGTEPTSDTSPRPLSDALVVGSLERVVSYLSAASKTTNVRARAIFVAEARLQFEATTTACDHARLLLEAAEAELVRLHDLQLALPEVHRG